MMPSVTWLKPILTSSAAADVRDGDLRSAAQRVPVERRDHRHRARRSDRATCGPASPWRRPLSKARMEPSSLMSPPETNARSPPPAAPVLRPNRRPRRRQRRRADGREKPMALRASGRSMVTTATPSSISSRTSEACRTNGEWRSHDPGVTLPIFCICGFRYAPPMEEGVRSEAESPRPELRARRPPAARVESRRRGAFPFTRATSPTGTEAVCGPSASTQASAHRRSRTSATATSSRGHRPLGGARSPTRWYSTTRTSRRRSAGSASRSTRSPTRRFGRRHPARRDQHQLHDQRHSGDPAGVLRGGRREAGRRSVEAAARSRTTSSRST